MTEQKGVAQLLKCKQRNKQSNQHLVQTKYREIYDIDLIVSI